MGFGRVPKLAGTASWLAPFVSTMAPPTFTLPVYVVGALTYYATQSLGRPWNVKDRKS